MSTLTEEEKKKQNINSQTSNTPITLDEWYGKNLDSIKTDAQKQKESAYVDMQLLNKYLPEQLAHQGLSNTGVANAYSNQNDINYRNQIANINANTKQQELDLYNRYYAQKQDEQDREQLKIEEQQKNMFDMYRNKVDNSLNQYGYLDDEAKSQLSEYFNRESIGEHYSSILDEYMNSYTATDEQKAYIQEQENITKYSPYYEEYANQFLEKASNNLLSNKRLSSEQVQNYLKELEEIKHKIGDFYYEEIKQALLEFEETENERRIREAFEKAESSTSTKENTNKSSGGGGSFGGGR